MARRKIKLDCERKIFLVDTSVLLYDKEAIKSFTGHDVVLPLVVLDELDRFKEKPGLLGENARFINRFLDDLRSIGNLHDGVLLDNQQKIKVEVKSYPIPDELEKTSGDNRIIGAALEYAKSNNVTVVTKDINFRVKCDSLGIHAEDYFKDRVIDDAQEIYSGYQEVFVRDEDIDSFFQEGMLRKSYVSDAINQNEYVIGKSETSNKSFLGVCINDNIVKLTDTITAKAGINPKNKEQKFAIDMLSRDDIALMSLIGLAGTGKTFITVAAAFSGLMQKKYDKIVITRSMQTVGKDIGYLPGDINEKMNPWIMPIIDNFQQITKDNIYFNMMMEKGQIEIVPLSFIRGRTFNRTFLIVDEAQNSTIHELKTIITRVGENSKIVLLGDVDQIDTPYLDSLSNGLTIVVEKFKNHNITAHITLMKGERSALSALASKVL